MQFEHTPVLYDEVLSNMRIFEDRQNIIVDMTLGLGGHASGIVKKLRPGDVFIGFDADSENLAQARVHISQAAENIPGLTLHFVHSNFRHAKRELLKLGYPVITGVLADLGVSSAHFDDAKRGFSFRFSGPLDMRFDRTSSDTTAADILREYSTKELEDIFYRYGEEPKTRFIVEAIDIARKQKPITTTEELAEIITTSSFDPKSKLRVFQALRMEVNEELSVIDEMLENMIHMLSPAGTISIITFHSLEDRTVKQIFAKYQKDICDPRTGMTRTPRILEKLHKKPLIPSETEIQNNPRSRSAKLRVVEKRVSPRS